MINNLPEFHKDQTFESLVSTIAISNGISLGKLLTDYLFSSPHINYKNQSFKGLNDFYETVGKYKYSSMKDLFYQHSTLAIYFTFLSKEQQNSILKSLFENRVHGVMKQVDGGGAGSKVFHNNEYYCPECVLEEIKNYGYAYTHRTNQLASVYFCPIHECQLGYIDNEKLSKKTFPGLLLNGQKLKFTSISTISNTNQQNQKLIDISKWVYFLYQRQSKENFLPYLSQIILSFLSNKSFPGDVSYEFEKYQKIIKHCFSNSYLHQLDLKLDERIDPIGWPFLYLYGFSNYKDLNTKLLFVTALFKNPNEFDLFSNIVNIKKSQPDGKFCKKSRFNLQLTPEILDLLINEPNLDKIEDKLSLPYGHLEDYFYESPILEQRRKIQLSNNISIRKDAA